MGGDEHGGIGHELSPDDQLLLIAARQRVGRDVDARGSDVELLADPFGLRACADAVDEPAVAVGSGGLMTERCVLPEG